jgi:hypothetical protein
VRPGAVDLLGVGRTIDTRPTHISACHSIPGLSFCRVVRCASAGRA